MEKRIVRNKRKLISIVTPCFNEGDTVQDCYLQTKTVMEQSLTHYDYEHIFCDNASTDNTLELLKKIAQADHRVKVISNSRNFGPFNSMFNGVLATRGDLVVPFLPADCQDPPEVIPHMVAKAELGHEVVYGIRASREEGFFLRLSRGIYYRILNRFSSLRVPENVGEFGIIDKKVVESLRMVDDYYPYLRGLIANAGFNTASVPYTWVARKKGKSKNSLYDLFDQALNGIISFTGVPMRLVMLLGFSVAFLSFLFALVNVVVGLIWFREFSPPGTQTIIAALFFFFGLNFFVLGFLGEYIGAIHSQVRKRPLVIERERINF
jgi:glycosyltransferase involved in cell wall biosynthesis